MLLRDLKTCFGVGIVLVLFALGLHAVYPCSKAAADAGYVLLNVFAAALACTILTFFIGALLFAHQIVRAEAKRNEQHRTLLLAELNEIAESLNLTSATGTRLTCGPKVKVMITHPNRRSSRKRSRTVSSIARG
jgi:uncharacterized protein (DUF58 family)